MFKNLLYQKTWHREIIFDFATSVRVRIFKSPTDVISNMYEKAIATDGQTFFKSPHTYTRHTQNHSYVVLSTGLHERGSNSSLYYIFIKLYITNNFSVSTLKNADFFEKKYVIDAIQEYLKGGLDEKEKPVLPPLLNYLQKKVGTDYKKLYYHLKNLAYIDDIDTVDQQFKDYNISAKYQALFWKEMYEEITKTKK